MVDTTDAVEREPIHWMGTIPKTCELSGRRITKSFVDGRIPGMTTWGKIHPSYFKAIGGKLGVGNGQRYEKQANGRWLKVEG